jgi:hypothetical protein
LTVLRNNDVILWQSALLRGMNRINVRLCVCQILNFERDAPREFSSDGAKRSMQYIQQKVGILFVKAHGR